MVRQLHSSMGFNSRSGECIMNRTIINYTFQIECDHDDAPNPVHLCEEIQAYLNSGYHYDEPFEMVEKAEVKGYHVKRDEFNPFYAQENY